MEQLQVIQSKIYEIRGQKVMLDFDLASLYGTETKYLKRSVKNNLKRFPSDFMFELTKEERDFLRCNFCTLKEGRGNHPTKHVCNIYLSEELYREATVSKMEIVRQEGNRSVRRILDLYNLDMILSIGYRVNSKNATLFRQ